jgi:D-3-phosphoglycerate dehydrogenase
MTGARRVSPDRVHAPDVETHCVDEDASPAHSLILDLLEWIGPGPRPYAETLEAWRTSCLRLPVWEDANDHGLITRHHAPDGGRLVSVSAAGTELLRRHRRRPTT